MYCVALHNCFIAMLDLLRFVSPVMNLKVIHGPVRLKLSMINLTNNITSFYTFLHEIYIFGLGVSQALFNLSLLQTTPGG